MTMDKENLLDEIERYLFGEMQPSEIAAFEDRLKRDEDLLKFTESHAAMLGDIDFYFSRKDVREKLFRIAAEQDIPVITLIPKANEPKPKKVFYTSLWVAAATALLISGVSVSLFIYLNGQMKNSAYKALRRDVEHIRSSQNKIISGFSLADKKESRNVNQFGGTGFAIGEEGIVVTSYHVIKGGDSIFVETQDGKHYKTTLIKSYPECDLAILQISDTSFKSWNRIPYSIRKTSAKLGEKVFTLGYPKDEIVYGEGTISSRSGFNGDTLSYQVSIPVNPGNSGGPLLDEKGNVIGIISGKQTESDGTAFAIRSGKLLQTIEELNSDSTRKPIKVQKYGITSGMPRTGQIGKVQDFVLNVKVFN
ncbi:MAG: S1C family serine protease [Bacteroidota bacterium]|jgi:serine protease Do